MVEVGGGLGLAGMAAARLGAATVTITDLPALLPLLRHNLTANRFGPGSPLPLSPNEPTSCSWAATTPPAAAAAVRALALDWKRCTVATAAAAWCGGAASESAAVTAWVGDNQRPGSAQGPPLVPPAPPPQCWVLGADVLYDPALIRPLAHTLHLLCCCAPTQAAGCKVLLALSHQSVEYGLLLSNFDELDR